MARPVSASRANHSCHASRGGTRVNVSSASWSSSGSRTTGHASSATSRIAASSSAPIFAAGVAERPAQLYGARAAFLERRVVEEGVRVRVQNLVAEQRRLGGVDGVRPDRAVFHAGDKIAQPIDIHRPRAGSRGSSRPPAGGAGSGSRRSGSRRTPPDRGRPRPTDRRIASGGFGGGTFFPPAKRRMASAPPMRSTASARRTSATAASPASGPPPPSPAAGTGRPPRAESCAARPARSPDRCQWPPPAARR